MACKGSGVRSDSLVIDRERGPRVVTCVTSLLRSERFRDVYGWSRSAACRVGLGEVAGDRLGSWAGIALQGAHRGVPGPGQEQWQVGAVLGGVGEGRGAQLMQRPPSTRLEELGRPPVRQP